jgi:uncharacterized protein YqeY
MLEDLIRKDLMQASKDKNVLAKNILSLALGEIQTVEARGKTLTEKDKQDIIFKLVKSNTQTFNQLPFGDQRGIDLQLENELLKQYLPKTLSRVETLTLMDSVDTSSCKTSGQAIGLVMKYAKTNNLPVDNVLVKELVEDLFNATCDPVC